MKSCSCKSAELIAKMAVLLRYKLVCDLIAGCFASIYIVGHMDPLGTGVVALIFWSLILTNLPWKILIIPYFSW